MTGHSKWSDTVHARLDVVLRELEDARDLALEIGEIIRQQPTPLSAYADDGSLDYERLPDWFTGANQGREFWNGGAE
jgi:hypothetical protein